METKEKLTEIIGNVVVNDKGNRIRDVFHPEFVEKIVNNLIEGGAIVPPCEVGDVLYVLGTCKDLFLVTTSPCPYEDVCWVTDCNSAADVKRVFPATVECIGIGDHDIYTICFESIDYEYYSTEIGKTVFLSYEEAEAALKGR